MGCPEFVREDVEDTDGDPEDEAHEVSLGAAVDDTEPGAENDGVGAAVEDRETGAEKVGVASEEGETLTETDELHVC